MFESRRSLSPYKIVLWLVSLIVHNKCMTAVFLFKLYMFHDCYKMFLFLTNIYLPIISFKSPNSSIITFIHRSINHFKLSLTSFQQLTVIFTPSEDIGLWQLPKRYPSFEEMASRFDE